MAPSIFIVPGFYEGSKVFQPLAECLKEAGLDVRITSVISTGTAPPDAPTQDDDVASIAADLRSAVEDSGDSGVVAVLHSAAGFLGGAALKGLTAAARKADGKNGGVKKIIFLCAACPPEGFVQELVHFMTVNEANGTESCRDPMDYLFHDLPEEQARAWNAGLMHMPWTGWSKPVTFCGWREVPSVYILCEEDRLLSVEVQEHCAKASDSKIVRLKAGHMAHLSQTREVARIIIDQIE